MITTIARTRAGGAARGPSSASLRAALLGTLALATAPAARALPPPVPVTQFDMTGYLQAATLDATDVLAGGTLTVNGQLVVVPRNVIVVLPATFLTWQQLFALAPPPYGPTQTGLALADTPPPFMPFEVHVIGNRVAQPGGSDRYMAGLVYLSQQSLNQGQGYVNFIDYTTGELRVGGIIGDPTTGQRVRLDDPLGKFGRVSTADARFSIDEDNPTVRTETGFPMCVPRFDPGAQDDPLCPKGNRPLDPVAGTFQSQIHMPAPAAVVAGGPDPMLMAPLEVGDYVTYAGTLVKDGTQPTAGPAPALSASYLSAWQVIANVGIWTAPGVDPAYVAVDVALMGTGGVSALGAAEASIRTRFEGFTTDPFRLAGTDPTCSDPAFRKTLGQPCSAVDLYGIDVDPCTGAATDRPWGAIDVDQGPPTGVKPGRWRFRPPSRVLPLAGASGIFDPPTQMVHARLRGANTVVTKNGLLAGQYQAPITQLIFPENGVTGSPIVANNFESVPYLARGQGPLGPGGPIVGQLSPWPGAAAPLAASCTPATLTPPTASAGPAQTVPSGASVALDGSASSDPNGLPLTFAWTQTAGLPAPLNSASAMRPTFTAPTVPAGTAAASLVFSLVVTDTAGLSSTAATVTITVSPAPAGVLAPVASAGANRTVASGAHVVLDGTASSDPNVPPLPLTYAWTQVSPLTPLVTLAGASTATPTFTAPVVPPGAPLVMQFHLAVTNSAGLGASALVTITVSAAVPPIANAGADQTVAGGTPVTLNGSASVDPNGLPLTFAWTQVAGPPVVLSGATTAAPSFTAPALAAGSVTLGFTLVVSDGLLASVPALVTVTVLAGADTVQIISAVYRLDKQRLQVTATSSAPAAQLFLVDPAGGANIPLTPGVGGVPTIILVGIADPGTVTVVSSLGGKATSNITRLRAVGGTLPPFASAGTNATVVPGANVVLNGTGSADLNVPPLPITFAWSQVSPATPAVTLTGATTATPSFTAPALPSAAPLALQFKLTVTNSATLASTAFVTVTVSPPAPPVARAGPSQTVTSGAAVTLDGTASTSPNGVPLAFAWTQTAGPAVTLTSSTVAKPSFTAPVVPSGGSPLTLTFSLVVSDPVGGASAPSAVTVTVQPAALVQAPVASAGANVTVTAGATVTLNGTASADPNLPPRPLAFTWTQLSGPAVALAGATTPTPTFTAPTLAAGSAPVTLGFGLTVSNGLLTSVPALVTVKVLPGTDTVTIVQAIYRVGQRRLVVTATSSDPTAQLFLTAPPGQIAPTPSGFPMPVVAGVPTVVLRRVADPGTVTVVSSLGGTATAPTIRK